MRINFDSKTVSPFLTSLNSSDKCETSNTLELHKCHSDERYIESNCTLALSINMLFPKLGLVVLTILTATVLTDGVDLASFHWGTQVLAQATDARKVEADRLLQQGIEQHQTSQFVAALQSWRQALFIYREIKDLRGEGQALVNLGAVYDSLGDYPKAIDYLQQSLKIVRFLKDLRGESIFYYLR